MVYVLTQDVYQHMTIVVCGSLQLDIHVLFLVVSSTCKVRYRWIKSFSCLFSNHYWCIVCVYLYSTCDAILYSLCVKCLEKGNSWSNLFIPIASHSYTISSLFIIFIPRIFLNISCKENVFWRETILWPRYQYISIYCTC